MLQEGILVGDCSEEYFMIKFILLTLSFLMCSYLLRPYKIRLIHSDKYKFRLYDF
jgi:hypothetical protein